MRQWKVRVVKVGGSLLDRPGLGEELRRWLSGQTPAHHILVAGGGGWANLIRQADDRFGLSQQAAHWLCIRALRITARLLAELLPEAALVVELGQLRSCRPSDGPTIFDPWTFLRSVEPHLPGPRLPESWDVTSDSIAGRLAMVLAADELVLLKSASPGVEVVGVPRASRAPLPATLPAQSSDDEKDLGPATLWGGVGGGAEPVGRGDSTPAPLPTCERLPEVNLERMVRAGYVDRFFATLAPHLSQVRAVNFRVAAFPSWRVSTRAAEG
jgi:aspartokinase-like uncharacterized kinase